MLKVGSIFLLIFGLLTVTLAAVAKYDQETTKPTPPPVAESYTAQPDPADSNPGKPVQETTPTTEASSPTTPDTSQAQAPASSQQLAYVVPTQNEPLQNLNLGVDQHLIEQRQRADQNLAEQKQSLQARLTSIETTVLPSYEDNLLAYQTAYNSVGGQVDSPPSQDHPCRAVIAYTNLLATSASGIVSSLETSAQHHQEDIVLYEQVINGEISGDWIDPGHLSVEEILELYKIALLEVTAKLATARTCQQQINHYIGGFYLACQNSLEQFKLIVVAGIDLLNQAEPAELEGTTQLIQQIKDFRSELDQQVIACDTTQLRLLG